MTLTYLNWDDLEASLTSRGYAVAPAPVLDAAECRTLMALYGEVAFPLQAVVFLSRPGVDHQGGEFLLVEQRPRAQSMGDIVPAQQGGLALFTTHIRPVRGSRGYYRVHMRHGVTRVHQGTRFTLGIIFHDAK